ncbi:MAG: hypothetical protein GYB64_00320, partial [Chloroflexi bacterium]|nr:hypothetical protein [Chloroflexota bacterium]
AYRDLLDYLPFGEGVVYTTLPVDGDWALSLLPDLSAEPQIVDLGELAQPLGAPRVLSAP